jgi:hypothetical protein
MKNNMAKQRRMRKFMLPLASTTDFLLSNSCFLLIIHFHESMNSVTWPIHRHSFTLRISAHIGCSDF